MFSQRVPPHAELNPISRALAELRGAGVRVVDLTESNPTRTGFEYPADLLAGLGSADGRRYDPHPLGAPAAREAVAADYARRGARVDPADVVLTASSSESYSWLFKLLCNPGEAVLVPQPSYPLFEHLTRLEGVQAVPYRLRYHGRWDIDIDSIAAAPAHVRAVLLVSPNNPTGSYVSADEAHRIAEVSRRRGWAIVSDEVFADYPLDERAAATESVMALGTLSFTLGGASKSWGLPQVKLGWMVAGGAPAVRRQAIDALEIVADAYLSVSTPVQLAAPDLIRRAPAVRAQIQRRIQANLTRALDLVRNYPSCDALRVEGGWSLVLRVPATRPEETLVLELLAQEHVLVHPGYFFDFAHEAFIIVSLLPSEDTFVHALDRVLRFAAGDNRI